MGKYSYIELLVKRYLLDELTGQELSEFNERMERDANFARFVRGLEKRLEDDVVASVNLLDFRKEILKLSKEKPGYQKRINLQFLLRVAAVLVIVGAPIFYFRSIFFPSKIDTITVFIEQYEKPVIGQSRSNIESEVDSTWIAASSRYAENDFNAARALFTQYRRNKPQSYGAQFYEAICLLELDKTQEAIVMFEKVSLNSNAFREESSWYLALTFLKEANKKACVSLLKKLSSAHGTKSESAKGLLEKIENKDWG